MAEVYEMLAKIGIKNEASAALLTITSQLVTMHNIVEKIGQGFGGWKLALGSIGTMLVGGAMFKGLEDLAKHGGVINHQIELMKIAGMTNLEIQEAMAQASKTAGSVLTTSYGENLKNIAELRTVFGGMNFLPFFDQIAKANSQLNTVKGGGQDQVFQLAKALETAGKTLDPKEFLAYVDAMTKVVQVSHGMVTPEAFQQTFKYGRTATLGWSEEFVATILPRLIQEMASGQHGGGGGAGGPGNALMSAFGEVVSGRMSKDAAAEFERMGLGKAKHAKGEDQANVIGLAGRDLFIKNPYEWVQQILMPALAAKGITGQNEIIEQIGKMFQVRTASSIIAGMGLQGRFREGDQSQFEKDARLYRGGMGLGGYDEAIKNDYPTIVKAFHEQWKSLLETIGGPLMAPGGPVVKAMAAITSALGSFGQFAAAHPDEIKLILAAMAGIAGALVLLGGAAVIAAAAFLIPGGLVVAAVGGIAIALSTLAYLEWDKIKSAFEFIKTIPTILGSYANIAWEKIVTGLETMKTAIMGLIEWIGGAVSAVKHFFDLSRFLAKPTSYEGGGPTGANITPVSFNPSNQKQILQPIQMTLALDGRTLGQAMTDILEDLHTFPNSGGSGNGVDNWNSSGQRI